MFRDQGTPALLISAHYSPTSEAAVLRGRVLQRSAWGMQDVSAMHEVIIFESSSRDHLLVLNALHFLCTVCLPASLSSLLTVLSEEVVFVRLCRVISLGRKL